jgi:hypothetical protein
MTLKDWALADELIQELGALRLSLDDTRTEPVPPSDPAVASLRTTFDRTAVAIARIIDGAQDEVVVAEARRLIAEARVAVVRASAVIQDARAKRIQAVRARLDAAAVRERRAGRGRPARGPCNDQ